MARALPPQLTPSVKSDAERRLFGRIQADLSDEWTVLHSLGTLYHERKPWTEIDFVLIGPLGLYCLEVKGGRIARRQGRWLFTDRHGQEATKNEGPFEQAAGAAAALTHYLESHFPQIWSVTVGFGVLTPDVVFQLEGPDIEPNVVYDAKDEVHNFGRYLKRLSAYWTNRLESQRGRPMRGLEGPEVRRLTATLRADFDLRPSLRTRVGQVKDELLRLTEEQYRVLDGLAENPRVIIRGGAGTGKSLLAIEEARRHAEMGSRVLLWCYNRRLAFYIQAAVGENPKITVRHIHGFMAETVERAGLRSRLPRVDPNSLFSVFYPELTVEALLRSPPERLWDVLIIDEGQDLLLPSYLDVCDLLVRGGLKEGIWRVFLDPKQNIFEATHPQGMARLLGFAPAQFKLTVNCRNTVPIAINTALFSGTDPDETLIVGGPEVEIYWYRDEGDQRRQVARFLNRLLSDGVSTDDVVVLSRRRLSNSSLAPGLPNVVFSLREVEDDIRVPSQSIRYSTIPSFKGLEADAVVLVDVDDLLHEDSRKALYVGMSRARVILGLFLLRTVHTQYQELAQRLGERSVGVTRGEEDRDLRVGRGSGTLVSGKIKLGPREVEQTLDSVVPMLTCRGSDGLSSRLSPRGPALVPSAAPG